MHACNSNTWEDYEFKISLSTGVPFSNKPCLCYSHREIVKEAWKEDIQGEGIKGLCRYQHPTN